MKITHSLALLSVATATSLFPGVCPQAISQPALTAATMTGKPTLHQLRMKNVPSNIMAWWLDPVHKPIPTQFQIALNYAKGIFPPGMIKIDVTKPLGNYTIPGGIDIEKLEAINPQNILLVFGTDAGVAELQKTIALLDKPIRQVEVEVRYVEISQEDMKQLDITPMTVTADSGPWTRGIVKADTTEKIQELIKQNKAKILMAHRVTAINNLAAGQHSVQARPAKIEFEENGKGYGLLGPNSPDADSLLSIGVGIGIGFAALPTINEDGTITLSLAPGRTLQMAEIPGEAVGWKRNIDGVQTISNIHEDETIALMGGDSRLIGRLNHKNEKPSNVLLLVKPRILRRAE